MPKKVRRKRPMKPKALGKLAVRKAKTTGNALQRTLQRNIAQTRRDVASIMKKHAAMAADEVAETLRLRVEETTLEMQGELYGSLGDMKRAAKKAFKL